MKSLSFFTFLCLVSVYSLSAQNKNYEKDFNNAEKIFSKLYQNGKGEQLTYYKGGYSTIPTLYLNLYKIDPTNMNLAFKLGICYLNSRNERAKAISYFTKAVTAVSNNYKGGSYTEKNAPLIAYKFLGDAYHLNYKFDKAIVAYEKYIAIMAENKSTDEQLLKETNRKIEMCKTGIRLVASPLKIKIETLGNAVNSSYADYGPTMSADQSSLFFTSRRPQTKDTLKDAEGN